MAALKHSFCETNTKKHTVKVYFIQHLFDTHSLGQISRLGLLGEKNTNPQRLVQHLLKSVKQLRLDVLERNGIRNFSLLPNAAQFQQWTDFHDSYVKMFTIMWQLEHLNPWFWGEALRMSLQTNF